MAQLTGGDDDHVDDALVEPGGDMRQHTGVMFARNVYMYTLLREFLSLVSIELHQQKHDQLRLIPLRTSVLARKVYFVENGW